MAFEDDIHFTPLVFLRDKLLVLLVALVVIVFESLIFMVLRISTDAIVVIDGVQVTALVLVLVIEYARRARFYKNLAALANSLDKVSHFADYVSEPSFAEGIVTRQAIQEIALRAADEITELKAQNAESTDYTELWVHEIKTPLAAMQLVVDKMHGDDAKKLKFELERLERLVNQALFAARSSSLTNDYSIREVRLVDVVGEACKENVQYLTSLGIALDLQVDPELKVYADKSWLSFVISQIVTNSAKYGASTISFAAQEPDREGPEAQTVLEIRDDGCGIPAADVPRVFDRGFTGEVGRAHGSATGMGLYLAARLCTCMGLSIKVASEEGVGTRVLLGFPHDRGRMSMQLTKA